MKFERPQIKFEPRDIWVGLYWHRDKLLETNTERYRFYVCLIPCFPIILTIKK